MKKSWIIRRPPRWNNKKMKLKNQREGPLVMNKGMLMEEESTGIETEVELSAHNVMKVYERRPCL